jgi:GntR family transcriptional regulator, rspAB operon transcriptional repressor
MNKEKEKDWGRIERGQSLSEKTYARVKGLIISCNLKPTQDINEFELARQLGISRSPLREALSKLAEESLVEPLGRGMRVAPVTERNVLELYQLRMVLESFAARNAVGRISQEEISSTEAQMKATWAPLESGNPSPFNNEDFHFHELYVRNCGNSLIIDRLNRLRDQLRRIWTYVGISAEDTLLSYREHEAILDAVKLGDQAKLQVSVERHITNVGNRVAYALKEKDLERAPNGS